MLLWMHVRGQKWLTNPRVHVNTSKESWEYWSRHDYSKLWSSGPHPDRNYGSPLYEYHFLIWRWRVSPCLVLAFGHKPHRAHCALVAEWNEWWHKNDSVKQGFWGKSRHNIHTKFGKIFIGRQEGLTKPKFTWTCHTPEKSWTMWRHDSEKAVALSLLRQITTEYSHQSSAKSLSYQFLVIPCLALSWVSPVAPPFMVHTLRVFPLMRSPGGTWHCPTASVSSQSFKGKKGAASGMEAFLRLIELNSRA